MPETRILTAQDVRRFLDAESCVAVLEDALRAEHAGNAVAPGVLGTHAAGGSFHVKAAGLTTDRPYYVAKVNANFPGNPQRFGLPTIQGVVALYDAVNGRLLALMDSAEITTLRTAAMTAIAAKHLARPDARTLAIIGCGIQGRAHVRALRAVRSFERIFAWDANRDAARAFADVAREFGIEPTITDTVRAATLDADVIATCTTAHAPVLFHGDVRPGAFVGAVGADNEEKQEIDPALFAQCRVVVDVLEQCARIGDLHHAIEANVMTRDAVHATLGEIVNNKKPGRTDDAQVFLFDSTGTALADVAAAIHVYQSALSADAGLAVRLR